MFRKFFHLVLVSSLVISMSGCALLGVALSAAAGYGIYKATKK